MQFGAQTLLPCSSWPWLGTQHEQVMSTKFQEELQRSHLKAQVPILEIGVYLNHIFIKYHIIILMYNMNITSEPCDKQRAQPHSELDATGCQNE